MALARTALTLAPLILRARNRRPGKRQAGVIISIGLMSLSGFFLLISGFVWISKIYGTEYGFLALAIVFFLVANIVYFSPRAKTAQQEDIEAQLSADPLSHYIPDELKNDPRIQSFIDRVQDHPMGSTAAAASLGFILSTQLLGD